MAEEIKFTMYRCEECNTCFYHSDRGERAWGICPGGSGTYSRRLSKAEVIEKHRLTNERVSTKK